VEVQVPDHHLQEDPEVVADSNICHLEEQILKQNDENLFYAYY
jgi:hypothetical protein